MNEKISRFLDDDLSHDETLHLLQAMQAQPDLKETLKRYAAISHAMKTNDFLWIQSDFVSQIHEANNQVTTVYALPPSRRRHYWFMLAASVAVIAVLVEQKMNGLLMKQSNQSVSSQLSLQLADLKFNNVKEPHPFNAHIIDYFHEYNNSGYFDRKSFGRLTPDQQLQNLP
jgi:sigma-E factor negative regulatory protein RseA